MRNFVNIVISICALFAVGCQQYSEASDPCINIAAIHNSNYTIEGGSISYDIDIYFNLLVSRYVTDDEINLYCKADDYDYHVPVTNLRGDDSNKVVGSVSIPLEAFNQRAEGNPDLLMTNSWTLYLVADNGDVISKANLGRFEYTSISISDVKVADYSCKGSTVQYIVKIRTDSNLTEQMSFVASVDNGTTLVGEVISLYAGVATVSFSLPVSNLKIDYNSYSATSYEPFSIYAADRDGTALSNKIELYFHYNKTPRITFLTLDQLDTEDYNGSDGDWDKTTRYSFTYSVEGALFISDVYGYLIGNWTTTGKQDSFEVSIQDAQYDGGLWWISYYSDLSARKDYLQIRGASGSREIISDNSIQFYYDGSGGVTLTLVDSDSVTESTTRTDGTAPNRCSRY